MYVDDGMINAVRDVLDDRADEDTNPIDEMLMMVQAIGIVAIEGDAVNNDDHGDLIYSFGTMAAFARRGL